ncbi:MAG: hypothetical protein IT536_08285 [Hyphomicrobiales bacterium]|nr:hypothetical protein [Hyphomicrobiales bacterium]
MTSIAMLVALIVLGVLAWLWFGQVLASCSHGANAQSKDMRRQFVERRRKERRGKDLTSTYLGPERRKSNRRKS